MKDLLTKAFTVQNVIAAKPKEWLPDFPKKWASIPDLRNDVSWADFRAKFPESPDTMNLKEFRGWAFANLPYDYNTPTNKAIKAKLVEREVYCCLSDMVEALIEAEKLDIIKYLEYYGETGDGTVYTGPERDERVEELEQLLEDDELSGLDKEATQKELEELQELDCDRLPDIYEWWGVSSWLADKLKEEGQVVVDEFATSIWGRQTTGQAILLDSVISRIAFKIGILEYQENSWA